MKNKIIKVIGAAVVSIVIQGTAVASLVDFTDNSIFGSFNPITGGYSGSVDGIGFSLVSTGGSITLNRDGKYDGSSYTGCQSNSGPLMCDRDGLGIGDDEIAAGQTLTLTFDHNVFLSGFHFLDLYKGNGIEQATITIDNAFFNIVDAIGSGGDGGYASLLTAPIMGKSIEFSAAFGDVFKDDRSNDYALAGVNVSPVPIPGAVWLFGSAIASFAGFSRFKKKA